MNAIEGIRSEIERRIEEYKANESNAWYSSDYGDEDALWWQGHWKSLSKLLAFIDSLPESKQTLFEEIAMMPKTPIVDAESSDLEETAKESWAEYEYREHPKGLYYTCYIDGFKAGANWQKAQMIEHIKLAYGKTYLAYQDVIEHLNEM